MKRKNYIKSTPESTAENVLNREFYADGFGKKWLTDVTEMKYDINNKAYLSAILDLGDKSIVSFVFGHSNNNELVFKKRVSRCIDNGPMEAFWGMLKSEMYYLKKFNSYDELEAAVINYIDYYNNHHYQKTLDCMAPFLYRQHLMKQAV